MKILMLNNSGNVGKSFISRELIYPNLKKDKIIVEIETRNSSSLKFNINTVKIGGDDFSQLTKLFFQYDDLVIDLGSSQIEKFFSELKLNDKEVLDEIDLIVIPVIPNIKEVEDTLVSLKQLNKLNLKIQIKVLLNRCRDIKKFDFLINEAREMGYNINTKLQLQDYRAISDLEEDKILTDEILASDKDYKQEAKQAYRNGDKELGDKLSDLYMLRSAAKAIRKDLDKVYNLLVSEQ